MSNSPTHFSTSQKDEQNVDQDVIVTPKDQEDNKFKEETGSRCEICHKWEPLSLTPCLIDNKRMCRDCAMNGVICKEHTAKLFPEDNILLQKYEKGYHQWLKIPSKIAIYDIIPFILMIFVMIIGKSFNKDLYIDNLLLNIFLITLCPIIFSIISVVGLYWTKQRRFKRILIKYDWYRQSFFKEEWVDCIKCGHGNPIDAIFCNECGGRIKLSAIQCTKCGNLNPIDDAKFCSACASKLDKPQEISIKMNQTESMKSVIPSKETKLESGSVLGPISEYRCEICNEKVRNIIRCSVDNKIMCKKCAVGSICSIHYGKLTLEDQEKVSKRIHLHDLLKRLGKRLLIMDIPIFIISAILLNLNHDSSNSPIGYVFLITGFVILLIWLLILITVDDSSTSFYSNLFEKYHWYIQQQKDLKWWHCKICECENPPNSKYCNRCGNPIFVYKITCGLCAFVNPLGAKFCNNCGKPLQDHQ